MALVNVMDFVAHYVDNHRMDNIIRPMIDSIHYSPGLLTGSGHTCAICGSKSVGMNFGVVTCSPCKAFFRRNARRKELMELPCRHRDLSLFIKNDIEFNSRNARYLQIRRCSSCRLRRCFEVGMKEQLIRTEEENLRLKELIEINRTRREALKQQLVHIQQLATPQDIFGNSRLAEEIDWRHLSNIVYAYDTHCLKTFTQRRTEVIFKQVSSEQLPRTDPTSLTMAIVLAASSFLKSLPAFYSLCRRTRNYLCKTNIRPLIFPNIHELNQSCYSEPWQVTAYESIWQMMCGLQLYQGFTQVVGLANKFWVTDRIVIRLWMITMFFSTPLHYHDEGPLLTPILKNKVPVRQAQNAYITLLWKYLLHRYGDDQAVRIYSNLMFVYMKMQIVGFGIYTQLRTKVELRATHETLVKLVVVDTGEEQ